MFIMIILRLQAQEADINNDERHTHLSAKRAAKSLGNRLKHVLRVCERVCKIVMGRVLLPAALRSGAAQFSISN